MTFKPCSFRIVTDGDLEGHACVKGQARAATMLLGKLHSECQPKSGSINIRD